MKAQKSIGINTLKSKDRNGQKLSVINKTTEIKVSKNTQGGILKIDVNNYIFK